VASDQRKRCVFDNQWAVGTRIRTCPTCGFVSAGSLVRIDRQPTIPMSDTSSDCRDLDDRARQAILHLVRQLGVAGQLETFGVPGRLIAKPAAR
jgi:hypothetical protein